jgi:predicted MFS family arabinose efflux permease
LNVGPSGYGLLEAVIGGGAIVGAMATPQLVSRYKAGKLILAGVAGVGISYALTGLLGSFAFALTFLFCCGAASTVYLIPLISLTQRDSPDYVRGRVMSSRFLIAQAGLLGGMAVAGPLNDRVGAPLVFVTAGTLLVLAALVGFAFKNLRSASLSEEPAPPALKATG